MSYPSTARFFVIRDPNREGIDGKPSRVLEVMYRAKPEDEPREFAHVWDIQDSHPLMAKHNGKWTFNRSDVCILNKWWPAEYEHDTLQGMLDHLEATFVEGVPANQPD